MYTKRDLLFSIITGAVTGLIAALIFIHLNVSFTLAGMGFGDNAWFLLILIVPVLWILGTYVFGYKLSKFVPFLFQFSKFAAIGFLNAAIDFGLINLLVTITGITKGVNIIWINTISFSMATVNSYFWNKYWSFEEKSKIRFKQFIQFLVVSLIGILINDGIVFIGTTFIEPLYGLNAISWVNVIKIAGAAIALLWNFIGYRMIVFKKQESRDSSIIHGS